MHVILKANFNFSIHCANSVDVFGFWIACCIFAQCVHCACVLSEFGFGLFHLLSNNIEFPYVYPCSLEHLRSIKWNRMGTPTNNNQQLPLLTLNKWHRNNTNDDKAIDAKFKNKTENENENNENECKDTRHATRDIKKRSNDRKRNGCLKHSVNRAGSLDAITPLIHFK